MVCNIAAEVGGDTERVSVTLQRRSQGSQRGCDGENVMVRRRDVEIVRYMLDMDMVKKDMVDMDMVYMDMVNMSMVDMDTVYMDMVDMVSARCLPGVCRVSPWCLTGVSQVSPAPRCFLGVSVVSPKFLPGVSQVSPCSLQGVS